MITREDIEDLYYIENKIERITFIKELLDSMSVQNLKKEFDTFTESIDEFLISRNVCPYCEGDLSVSHESSQEKEEAWGNEYLIDETFLTCECCGHIYRTH